MTRKATTRMTDAEMRAAAILDAVLLKERAVSQQYLFSKGQLRKCRRLGGGPPFVRVGRAIFYRREAIEELLREHEVSI